MLRVAISDPMSGLLRCAHCGDVIGVYEPLVTVMEGRPLTTSRLNHPELGADAPGCYHRDCFEHTHGREHGLGPGGEP